MGGRCDTHFDTVQEKSMKGEASLWGRGAGSGIQTEGRGGVWCSEQSGGFCGGGAGNGGVRGRRIRHRTRHFSGAVALVRDRCGLPTQEDWERARSSAAGGAEPPTYPLTNRHAAINPCRASGSGRCGVSPLEGVGPHAVGPRGRLSPPTLISPIPAFPEAGVLDP